MKKGSARAVSGEKGSRIAFVALCALAGILLLTGDSGAGQHPGRITGARTGGGRFVTYRNLHPRE